MKKDDKKTRLSKRKGIKVGEGKWGGGAVVELREQRGRIRVLQWEIFFTQLQYVIPQLTPLASPPAKQSFRIRKLAEKRNNNSSNNKRKE